jgi:hypothetical protein
LLFLPLVYIILFNISFIANGDITFPVDSADW